MTGRQESKMNMYDAVIKHCNAHPTIVNSVPPFQAAIQDLSDLNDKLKIAAAEERLIISGVTTNKEVQRATLVDLVTDVAAQVFAFAADTDNHILKEQVDLKFSYFNRVRDEFLAPDCVNVLAAANANAAALVPYGVTAGKITALDTAITNYAITVAGPRNATSTRVSVSKTIQVLIRDCDKLLKERADRLVVQFKTTEAAFFNAYINNRIIVDAATSATQLKGTVTNGTVPVSGVKVEVIDQPFTTNTDANGEYILKIPIPGTYSIQFSHTGFPGNIVHNIKITLGQSAPLNFNFLPV